MSLKNLLPQNTSQRFSKKLRERLDHLQFGGFFSLLEAEEKNMRLVTGREGDLCFYWLVKETDGVICDAKFQAFGPIALIAAAEIASELVIRKNYDQASRISSELIDRHFRDKKEEAVFSVETHSYLNQVLSAIDKAVYQCIDIPYTASDYHTTPISWDLGDHPEGIPNWESLSTEEKIKIIKEVVDKEIRPYIELDAGGINILELKEEKEVVISYEGSCTTCHSSTGSTLSAIQQILKTRIHPALFVTPLIEGALTHSNHKS